MGLFVRELRVSPIGDPGDAVGFANLGLAPCVLQGVQVEYNQFMPATCNVVITDILPGGLSKVILTLAGQSTNIPMVAVAEHVLDDDGTESDVVTAPILSGMIQVNVTGADSIVDGVIVTLLVDYSCKGWAAALPGS
jgi:hypothetical protein